MKPLLITALLLTVLQAAGQDLPLAAPQEVGLSAEGLAKIDAEVQKFLDKKQLAGAITIVARHGKVAHFKAHGLMDIAAKKPMRKDTIFRIYSMTKAIISVAAMILEEEGKLKLDAPVSKYLPGTRGMKFRGAVAKPEMTVRDLLRHTSGLPNNSTVDRTMRQAGLPPLADSSLKEMTERLTTVPLIYPPGKGWHYSFAADLLARLVEAVSGQRLDGFLAERIFKPLRMKDTGFHVPEEKLDRFAVVYGNGLRVTSAPQPGTSGPFSFREMPKFLSGGGGLVSTATDYMRFCLMLSGKGEFDGVRLLKAETVAEMTRDQLPPGVGEISRRPRGRGFGLGFAVRIRKIDSEPSSIGEYEWLGGAGTEFWLSPREDLVVITLSQQLPMRQLGQAIKPIVYGAVITDPVEEKKANAECVRYHLFDSRVVDKTDNARLTLGTAVKSGNNPLFGADKPWEARYDNMYPNVIYDEEDRLYKCWYCPFIIDERTTRTPVEKRNPGSTDYMSARPNRREEALLYATSRDGIHWQKPELGIIEFGGNRKNNIVVRGPSGAGVYKDARDPNPERRYKAFYASQVGYMQLVRFSPDGLRWGPEIRCPEIRIESDCHANMTWSPELRKYIGIVRHYDKFPVVGNRKIARTESLDAVKWTRSTLAIEGSPQLQTHDMVIFRAGRVFLGLLGMMRYPSLKSRHGVRQHIELAWSPDSTTWHRICPGTPLVGHTAAKEKKYGAMPCDWGAMFPSTPVILDREIRIYYGASDWYFFDWRKGGLALATLRPDGWAGFEPVAADRPASITTTPLPCFGGSLRLSADVSGSGTIRVALLDENNKALAVSEPLTGSATDAELKWRGGFSLAELAGNRIRLKFELRAAKLYSFIL